MQMKIKLLLKDCLTRFWSEINRLVVNLPREVVAVSKTDKSNDSFFEHELRENWDCPQDYRAGKKEKEMGIFDGRVEELERLTYILTKRRKSSILVCGERGSGKTSLVYRAIHKAGLIDRNVIPVIISASQLKMEVSEQFIVENLIIRLRQSFNKTLKTTWHDIKFRCVLNRLYLKALARNIDETRTKSIKVDYLFLIIVFTLLAILFTFALCLLFFPAQTINISIGFAESYKNGSPAFKLISKTASIVVSLAIGIATWTFSRSYSISFGKDSQILENELINLLEKSKWHFIFVIDELDYLEVSPTKKENLKHLKAYKNLFHFMNASVVMVGDRNFYEMTIKNESDIYWTIFTDTIYLTCLSQSEIAEYVYKICKKPEAKQWEEVQNYILYEARGNFKKVIGKLRELHDPKSDKLIIKKRSFGALQRSQAKSFKLMSSYYDAKRNYLPGNAEKNEKLFNALYEVINPKIWTEEQTFSFASGYNQEQQYLIDFLEKVSVISQSITPGEMGTGRKLIANLAISEEAVNNIPDSFLSPVVHEQQLIDKLEDVEKSISFVEHKFGLSKTIGANVTGYEWLSSNFGLNPDLLKETSDFLGKVFIVKNFDKRNIYNRKPSGEIIKEDEVTPRIATLDSILVSSSNLYLLWEKRLETIEPDFTSFNFSQTDNPNYQFFEKLISSLSVDLFDKIKAQAHQIFYSKKYYKFIFLTSENSLAEALSSKINKSGFFHALFVIHDTDDTKKIISWIQNRGIVQRDHKFNVEHGLIQLQNNLVLCASPEIVNDGAGALCSFVTLDVNDINNIKFTLTLRDGAIFNFLYTVAKKDDKISGKLIRFDTVSDKSNNRGFGLMKKEFNGDFQYIKSQSKYFDLPADEKIKIEIKIDEKKLDVFSKTGRTKNKLGTFLVDRHRITKVGFVNQKNDIIISDLKIT
jgi:hypothetical protein